MAVYLFSVWSTSNLIPEAGSNPFQTNQTNGNPQVNDTYTIGAQGSQTIAIEDNENDVFEDDTDTPQFLDEPLSISGFSYPVGTQVQNEFILVTDQVDSNGDFIEITFIRFQPAVGGLSTTAYALSAPLPAGTTFTFTSARNNEVGPDAPLYPSFICFAAGTMVQTEGGEVAIETLTPGDLVVTLDNGLQPIRWIGEKLLSSAELKAKPHLRPIRIKAGAFAPDVPTRDLVVSPQHRILIRSKIAMRMFDAPEVFIHAKHLLGLAGVEIADDVHSVTYFHAMCDDHEIIQVDGAFAETLYTGTEAMKAMSTAARQEINEIFGDTPYLDRPLARLTPKGRLSKKLIERHVKNDKSLVEAL